MSHTINWFELPTADLERATRFYEAVLGIELKREHFSGNDTRMSIFPGAQESVRGALIADSRRKPNPDGAIVYLHAPQLDACLARVASSGGAVLLPRTDIGDPGFIAMVRDTEGNVVGLHAPR